jgi:hypothetical protein
VPVTIIKEKFMKKTLCFLISFFALAAVFAQNVEEITLEYQDEIELWLAQNSFLADVAIQKHDGIDLFTKPYLNPNYPEHKVYGKGGSVMDCFALGRFLTKSERYNFYVKAYSVISAENRQRFAPFRSYEVFKQSLIFNPDILFDSSSNSGLNKDFSEDFTYLMFYFVEKERRSPDYVYNVQLEQVESGNGKRMLIFPSSFNYALFRIDISNNIELVSFYGVG